MSSGVLSFSSVGSFCLASLPLKIWRLCDFYLAVVQVQYSLYVCVVRAYIRTYVRTYVRTDGRTDGRACVRMCAENKQCAQKTNSI